MVDIVDPATRSRMMSGIRGRDTKPERLVRRLLHREGFRFRLDSGKTLPGRPDVVLPSRNILIFVHGCFWHRHPDCRFAYNPKSNPEFWQEKFQQNVRRDELVIRTLKSRGWKVRVIWACQISESRIRRLADSMRRSAP